MNWTNFNIAVYLHYHLYTEVWATYSVVCIQLGGLQRNLLLDSFK